VTRHSVLSEGILLLLSFVISHLLCTVFRKFFLSWPKFSWFYGTPTFITVLTRPQSVLYYGPFEISAEDFTGAV